MGVRTDKYVKGSIIKDVQNLHENFSSKFKMWIKLYIGYLVMKYICQRRCIITYSC
jgi:hypothetical protein